MGGQQKQLEMDIKDTPLAEAANELLSKKQTKKNMTQQIEGEIKQLEEKVVKEMKAESRQQFRVSGKTFILEKKAATETLKIKK